MQPPVRAVHERLGRCSADRQGGRQAQEGGAGEDDDDDNDGEGALAAYGCLRALYTVLERCALLPEARCVYVSSEPPSPCFPPFSVAWSEGICPLC